jgi:hypothetical protein
MMDDHICDKSAREAREGTGFCCGMKCWWVSSDKIE